MKLLIALTPAVLISCALVETWASITTAKKQPTPPAVSTAKGPAPRPVPVFTFGEAPATVAAVPTSATSWAVARTQVGDPSRP